jgi:hypothetical protein
MVAGVGFIIVYMKLYPGKKLHVQRKADTQTPTWHRMTHAYMCWGLGSIASVHEVIVLQQSIWAKRGAIGARIHVQHEHT